MGYWTFDDTLNDSSPNGFHGMPGGSPTYSTTVPPLIGSGKSVDLNGSSHVAVLPTGSVTGSYTVAGWGQVRTNSACNMFDTRRPTDCGFDMKFQNGNQIHGDIGNGSSWITTSANADFNYAQNTWYHVAYAVTPTSYTIHIHNADGSEARTPVSASYGASTPVLYDSAHAINIGRYSGDGEYFDGLIDDVAIWDVALTSPQVAALAAGTAPPDILGPAPPPPPPVGTIGFVPITNDADSDISASKTYTHALDPGTGPVAVVNGVAFTQVTTGSLPMATFDWQPVGGSRNDFGDSGYGLVTGNVRNLFTDFIYNGGNPAGNIVTATLSGLVPGAEYDTRLYARQWDAGTIRQAVIGFDVDSDGTPDNTVAVDQNHASSVGFSDDRQAYALSYTFTAESTELDITFQQVFSNASWHLYGVTNEIVKAPLGMAPVRGLMTADNHYQLFLSDDDSALGTLIAQSDGGGSDWNSPETYGFLAPTDQTLYLHAIVVNDDPPGMGGLIAHLEMPIEYVFLETGTNMLETSELLWLANDTGFGDPMVNAISHGTYGIGPWWTNCNPDLPGTAHWLWLGEDYPAGTLYFSAAITLELIPEPTTMLLLGAGLFGLLRRRRRA